MRIRILIRRRGQAALVGVYILYIKIWNSTWPMYMIDFLLRNDIIFQKKYLAFFRIMFFLNYTHFCVFRMSIEFYNY